MRNMMEYKGYYGSVNYSDDDEVFYGQLEFIRSLIMYEGKDVTGLKKAFHEAVDDYLQDCTEENVDPEIPFKGTFNVRVGKDLHRKAAIFAKNHHKKLNEVIKEALIHYII